MCLTTMETKPKHTKNCCLFKSVRPASQLRWRLLRVTAEDGAVTLGRSSAVRATIQKYLGRQPRRTQRAKVARALLEREEESVGDEGRAFARVRAMAPANTTQYLMSNVYDEMDSSDQTAAEPHSTSTRVYDDGLSPRSVYAALDRDFDDCLAYQQRDFEQAYGLQC